MKVSEFDFSLPDEAIALRPVVPRDHARLLEVNRGGCVSDFHVYDLPELLQPGDVLVINETRVFPAALTAIRPARSHGGGGDVAITVNLHKQISENTWRAFVRPAKRLRAGDELIFSAKLSAVVLQKEAGDTALEFNLSDEMLLSKFEQLGAPPLPPYIARQRSADQQDVSDYQTVYAKETGSVAAPTAGLHFTQELFKKLRSKGVILQTVVLHVGAGTFLPVKSDDTDDHKMHKEWFSISEVSARAINSAKLEGRRVIAVGTTTLRALESSVVNGQVVPQSSDTDIFITPGYDFQIVDGLMTNFHLPKSTLFMLVSALCGQDVMQSAYAYAIEEGYRFYSYGDTSLLWRSN